MSSTDSVNDSTPMAIRQSPAAPMWAVRPTGPGPPPRRQGSQPPGACPTSAESTPPVLLRPRPTRPPVARPVPAPLSTAVPPPSAELAGLLAGVGVSGPVPVGGVPGDQRPLTRLLKDLGRGPKWEQAVAIVDHLRAIDYPLDAHAATTAIAVVGRRGRVDAALALFSSLRARAGPPVSVVTYTAVIAAHASCGDYASSMALLGSMRAAGVAPNAHSHAAVFGACTAAGTADAADAAWGLFQSLTRVTPLTRVPDGKDSMDVVACAALLTALRCTGDAAAAAGRGEAVAAWMESCGILPDSHVHAAHLLLLGGGGRWRRALSVYDNMQVPVTNHTAAAVIGALAAGRRCDDAAAVFHGLESVIPPSPVTVGALLSAYERAGRWRDALSLLEGATARGCPLTAVMANTALSACAKAGQWRRAESLFESMTPRGAVPDLVSHECLLAAYGAAGEPARAELALRRLRAAGHPVRDYSYSALVAAHGNAGTAAGLRRALGVRGRMRAAGHAPTVHTANAMLDVLCRSRRYGDALAEYESMKNIPGIFPNGRTAEIMADVAAGGTAVVGATQALVSAAAAAAAAAAGIAINAGLI